jgi:hypothetical protein
MALSQLNICIKPIKKLCDFHSVTSPLSINIYHFWIPLQGEEPYGIQTGGDPPILYVSHVPKKKRVI